MTAYNLDVSEIANIFRDSLNVQPLSKTVAGIFANDRFRKKVDYAPFFQRNYVWDRSKATYFIESVILGTEIPPIVLFKDGTSYEVIDGRQRYETLLKFVEGSLSLDSGGLKRLRHLAGLHYADLPQQVKDSFDETKLRLLIFSVVNEPKMTSRQKDKVKREIFNRYNSGVTSLKREEVERAEYDSDLVTNYFYQRFEADEDFLACCEALFNASTKKKAPLRDRINSLLSRVRALLTMRFIPIHSYAYGKGKNDIVATFYSTNVSQCAPDELFENFRSRVNKLTMLRQLLSGSMILKNNRLVNETAYWALSIVEDEYNKGTLFDLRSFADTLLTVDSDESIWEGLPAAYHGIEKTFASQGSHYDKAIIARYGLVARCVNRMIDIDFSKHLDDRVRYKQLMNGVKNADDYDFLRLPKPDPRSESIDDILVNVQKNRFLIRPAYQRSEVTDTAKASYLIESIILGIRIPPIFVYKRTDGVSEVVDGQQRLLSIIGFLGKSFIDEHGVAQQSQKNSFRLKGLRILKELNGYSAARVQEEYPEYYDLILDFGIDVIEIDGYLNQDFSAIDLFQRLNSRPLPIRPNSFEMWNSYIDRKIVDKAKAIVHEHFGEFFRQKDPRMKNEELVTILAATNYQAVCDGIKLSDSFLMFVRDGKLSVRVRDASKITRVLDTASDNDVDGFLSSMERVNDFLNKLSILAGDRFDGLKAIVSSGSTTRKRAISNKEAYLLWMLLEKADLDGLRRQTSDIRSVLYEVFCEEKSEKYNYEPHLFVEEKSVEIAKITLRD